MLEIELPFKCVSRGDCCRETPYVVVTEQERALLPEARYEPHDRAGFYRLMAKPCPFLTDNRCSVYDIRPYNCRRFMCGRPRKSNEPWIMRESGECRNFTARLVNVRFARHAREVQQQAQAWAQEHGW